MNMTQIAPYNPRRDQRALARRDPAPQRRPLSPFVAWGGIHGPRGQAGIQRDKGLDIIASPLLPRAWLGACP